MLTTIFEWHKFHRGTSAAETARRVNYVYEEAAVQQTRFVNDKDKISDELDRY